MNSVLLQSDVLVLGREFERVVSGLIHTKEYRKRVVSGLIHTKEYRERVVSGLIHTKECREVCIWIDTY